MMKTLRERIEKQFTKALNFVTSRYPEIKDRVQLNINPRVLVPSAELLENGTVRINVNSAHALLPGLDRIFVHELGHAVHYLRLFDKHGFEKAREEVEKKNPHISEAFAEWLASKYSGGYYVMPAAATVVHIASLVNSHYYFHHSSAGLIPSLFLLFASAGKTYSWPYYRRLIKLFEKGLTPDRYEDLEKGLGRFRILARLDRLSTKVFTALISFRQLSYYLRRSFKR